MQSVEFETRWTKILIISLASLIDCLELFKTRFVPSPKLLHLKRAYIRSGFPVIGTDSILMFEITTGKTKSKRHSVARFTFFIFKNSKHLGELWNSKTVLGILKGRQICERPKQTNWRNASQPLWNALEEFFEVVIP